MVVRNWLLLFAVIVGSSSLLCFIMTLLMSSNKMVVPDKSLSFGNQRVRGSEAGKSVGFITRRSRVRAPLSLQSPNSQELGFFVDNQWVKSSNLLTISI